LPFQTYNDVDRTFYESITFKQFDRCNSSTCNPAVQQKGIVDPDRTLPAANWQTR
jgi:hypothetical protein